MIIPFEQSLMDFQARVLAQGTPSKNIYTFEEIKQLIFFNKVFISNTEEMFEKYDMKPYITRYATLLQQYNANVELIAGHMKSLGIVFNHGYTFENRLLMDTEIDDQLIRVPTNIPVIRKGYSIWTRTTSGWFISYADKKRSIYNKPLSSNINGKLTYFRTMESLVDYTDDMLNLPEISSSCVKSTFNGDIVTKIEVMGNTDIGVELAKAYPSALVIINKNIYIDDLEQIVDNYVSFKQHERQEVDMINPLSTMTKDIILEYPSDSFNDYLYFLKSALKDRDVKKIHITLYRIGKDPSLYYILKDAVAKGIKVYVQLELQARGDERMNRIWLKEFTKSGINVSTFKSGIIKVHSKLTLVEYENGRMVVQVGTGNYHTKTVTQYTDLNMITSDDSICKSVKKLFNLFEGKTETIMPSNDVVWQINLREELYKLIDSQANNSGFIFIKCNSLDDKGVIERLENAAKNGCRIEILARSVCTWIPESKNVRIRSIVWNKLEHSRVWCFGNRNPKVYIGSLDLVKGKMNNRIETMVRVKSPEALIKLVDYINRYITTKEGSWIMENGTYRKEIK